MSLTYTAPTRPIMRDCTVMSCTPYANGVAGTPVDFLGVIETAEVSLKREYTSTEASSDNANYKRSTRWGEGSVKLTGFSGATASKFAALFAAGSHATLQLTETSTGDAYQVLVRLEEFSKSMGRDATKDTLTMPQEGVPYYGTAGASVTAMTLDSTSLERTASTQK